MKKYLILWILVLLPSCGTIFSQYFDKKQSTPITLTAYQYINYNENTHRQELYQLTGVDPIRVEWCAAFVNAVLRDSNMHGSDSVSEYPLMARSFLLMPQIDKQELQSGDVVVFPRGNVSWQGHVGFYLDSIYIRDKEFFRILGGNQNNSVTIELFPANTALGFVRPYSLI